MGARSRGYGWISDLPDHRDYPYVVPKRVARGLPRRVDLRASFPRVYNQGQLQSCTANAVAAAVQFARRTEGLRPDFLPSRLLIYYNARALQAHTRCDTGSQIRDAIKCVAAQGVCSEDLWPYRVPRFEVKPSPRCYRAASAHRAIRYQRVRRDPGLVAMRACLASGYPLVFGMAVYTGFESVRVERSGVAQMPGRGERHIGHGHAVLAVGYDDAARRFIVRNSWGERWGQHGYFTLPCAYLAEPGLSDDFWTIRVVNA
ncbi:MAG TPA: C1 family peptidase [bacterium]|nr:C1 family peptidase [bacterium]